MLNTILSDRRPILQIIKVISEKRFDITIKRYLAFVFLIYLL